MTGLIKTAACIAIGFAGYLVLFGLVLGAPVKSGVLHSFLQQKLEYAEQARSPKIVISAGSSGLFGVRCEMIERAIHVPCVNMSLHAGMGMFGVAELARRVARRGDLVILPLEYTMYTSGGYGDQIRRYATRYDHDLLLSMPPERVVWSIFDFDLPTLFDILVQNWLVHVSGYRPQMAGTDTLSPQGDMRRHTKARAKRYQPELRTLPPSTTEMRKISPESEALPLLEDFLRWARVRGIRVVGTLPPTFASGRIDRRALSVIKSVFEGEDQSFVVLDNRSLYPLACFFDTADHLTEECQIRHTARLIGKLMHLQDEGELLVPVSRRGALTSQYRTR